MYRFLYLLKARAYLRGCKRGLIALLGDRRARNPRIIAEALSSWSRYNV